MDRRAFLTIAGLGTLAALAGNGRLALAASDDPAATSEFSWDWLRARAQELALKPYEPPQRLSETALAGLDYSRYRAISFRDDKAIWRNDDRPVQMQLFHSGYLYQEPVDIHLVENGHASRVRYDRVMFDLGPAEGRVDLPDDPGFSGFRLHAPVNEPDVFTEFLVFQGASYFRGRAKGQVYGLSARGLAIDTAQPAGEEFPTFRSFWVATPAPGDETVTVYALLDSESVSGAYRFTISRTVDLMMDVECVLHPRRALGYVGIAPFSSMYWFGPADPSFHDDFRPRVHDSDGLLIQTAPDEWTWRPLVTARHILYSVFSGPAPLGFGLMQREREYDLYQDLNADYEKRPGAWVEPLSDWGDGSVDLIELPTDSEYVDNIVAFWRPANQLQPGQSRSYRYRLTWCWHVPLKRKVARVVRTGVGKGIPAGSRYFAIDFVGGGLHAEADDEHWDYDVSASAGTIRAFTVSPNRVDDGKRVGIEYYPDGDKVADLSLQIRRFGEPVTEKWVYRWAP